MRILGGVLIVFGLLLCLSIIGAFVGVPMIICGIVLVALGGRSPQITNIVSVQNAPASRADFGTQAPELSPAQREMRREPLLEHAHFEAIQPPAVAYDKGKWKTLVKYDPDIRLAAQRVRPFGDAYEDELAEAYLQVNDKAYLESIVKKIIEDAQAHTP